MYPDGKFIRAAKEEIVVEGIETEEQRQFLESHGLNMGRGICLTGRSRQMNLKENIYKSVLLASVLLPGEQ